MEFPSLSPACGSPETETAQRFLASAYDSVVAVLETFEIVVELRREEVNATRGRLTASEEDLLRAAIIFTGAGLDATLKQLIRDTLPTLLGTNDLAHDKFETFAADRLGTGELADTRAIARSLTSHDPRGRLIEDYIYALTGASLQSTEEVQRVAGALGIEDSVIRRRIGELKPLFVARNEISHELDLKRPERPGDRGRRARPIAATKELCHLGLEIGQLIVNVR